MAQCILASAITQLLSRSFRLKLLVCIFLLRRRYGETGRPQGTRHGRGNMERCGISFIPDYCTDAYSIANGRQFQAFLIFTSHALIYSYRNIDLWFSKCFDNHILVGQWHFLGKCKMYGTNEPGCDHVNCGYR